MSRLFGYVRVSTDKQDNSVQNQEDKIREYAAKEGLEIAQIFVDEDVTARIPLRLAMAKRTQIRTEPPDAQRVKKIH